MRFSPIRRHFGGCRCRRPRAPLALPGAQLIEWGGAQRWLRSPTADAADAHAHAAAKRPAAMPRCSAPARDKRSAGVFQPLAPALAAIHRRLKAGFDPAGIFNPGRMYPDF